MISDRSDADEIHAAGILFVTPERQALFLKRGPGGDYPGFWCLPGGKQEPGETIEECAVREAKEETGSAVPQGEREELARNRSYGPPAPPDDPGAPLPVEAPSYIVDFTTFLQRIKEPFVPERDSEHVGYAWAPVGQPPEPLHPGVSIALRRLNADELDVARMIQAGELTSPQRFRNMWLFALRITGTGAAVRKAKKDDKTGKVIRDQEYVWRKPEHYLNDDFLERCQGVPTIWDHPEGNTLDSKEYGQRVIGAIMLPFIGDGIHFPADEVWGVARIHDHAAAIVMATIQLSTSPTVCIGDEEDPDLVLQADDGKRLLIEGPPTLIDHIAICGQGVWDKGGEPRGVSTSTSTTTYGDSEPMTEEEKKAAEEKARKDSEERADREKCMADAMTSMADSVKGLAARFDSVEAIAKEAKEKADKACADSESEDDKKKRADKAKADAEESERKEKEKADAAEKEKADKERADSSKTLEDIKREIATLSARTQPRTPEQKREFADAQARADSAYVMLGRQAPAPMEGEGLPDYRRRLATGLKVHSQVWKEVALEGIADDTTFIPIEAQILADAIAYGKRPPEGETSVLRCISRKDDSGHTINEYYGPANSWMDSFSGSRQRAIGVFKTPNAGGVH